MVDVVINQLDTNADFVILQNWIVDDGAFVSKDDPICEVETSKSVIEIASPADGFLMHTAVMGEELKAGVVVGKIVDKYERNDRKTQTTADAPNTINKGVDRISFKARDLMEAHNITLDELPADGFITVADVEKCISERIQKKNLDSGGIFKRLGKLNTGGVTFPSGCSDLAEGKIAQDFLKRILVEQETLRLLPNMEKISLLRKYGASIGEGVSIGEGTLIYAPQIVIRDGVTIGARGTIFCQERFIVGRMTRFGNDLTLRCQQAVVGAGVFAEDKIIIGGGGHQDPWAVIAIGDNCYLGSELLLNTCRPILIGRNVFVTNRSTLLTHNVGHSYIDGHENRFAPVVLEDASQVGINSVVYAGARICTQAVVGSNSYVVGSIPAGKLAMGVPARVIGDAQQTLTLKKKEDRAREIFADLRELLECKDYSVASLAEEGSEFVVTYEGAKYGLAMRPQGDLSNLPSDVSWVVWTLDSPSVEIDDGTVLMDLLKKEIIGTGPIIWSGSVREYLRKRGLKFMPGPWRYSGGLV